MSKVVNFHIESIDPLGQGVSKNSEGIFFIPKTLPSEKGEAKICKSRKGVHFATATSIDQPSKERIKPECPHYQNCPGCHFLHTTYEQELNFKKAALLCQFWSGSSEISEKISQLLQIHPAQERFNYRNRMQLHYDLSQKVVGLIDAMSGKIVEIQHCCLPIAPVKNAIKDLYRDQDRFFNKASLHRSKSGHVELYFQENTLQCSFNDEYAQGGFSQVNEKMNTQLVSLVESQVRALAGPLSTIFDLFGGKGNLTANLKEFSCWVIDHNALQDSPLPSHQTFVPCNLYDEEAPAFIAKNRPEGPTILILDPPRSGLKNLNQFLNSLTPEHIVYVSCDPATLARDLKSIDEDYHLNDLHLFDFFPGTRHFETVAILSKT